MKDASSGCDEETSWAVAYRKPDERDEIRLHERDAACLIGVRGVTILKCSS